jgi:hypothetical protein
MSKFSCLEILKDKAKQIARESGIKRSAALDIVAQQAGFAHYHEMQTVAGRAPLERRLMVAALGVSDLADAIYEDSIYYGLDDELSDQLSGEIASTNATEFTIEDLLIESSQYDSSTGVLRLVGSLTYQGEQLDDKPFSGTEFYLDVVVQLVRRNGEWRFDKEAGLTITSAVTDQELDWQSQHLK